jgi:IS5 family transposase
MLTNRTTKAVFVDRGYRGIEVPSVSIWRSGQKRGVTPSIKKAIHRRSAIEPAIGHMKNDGRLRRNWLKGALGDALHAMLCGAGHNLRMILRAIRLFCGQCFASQLQLIIVVIHQHLNGTQFNQLKTA